MCFQWILCAQLLKFFICNIVHVLTILSKIRYYSDAVDYFKELPFYNKPIERPKIKRLKYIYQSAELPFYEKRSVIKTNQAFRWYAMSYKVEIIERKVLIVQLEASKSSTEDLFSDLLNGKKGFKYQITVKFLLKKFKLNGEIEFEHYCKQLPVPFKIYADFECNLRGVESCEGSYTKNIKITSPVVLLTKLFVLIIGWLSLLLFIGVKMQFTNLLNQLLRSTSTAKK